LKLSEVFGVSKQRVQSYLERETVDGLFVKAVASDKQIIVYGSSKQGKTSLVDKHLPYESNVLVSCTPKFESIDIYKSILRSEDIHLETISEKASSVSGKVAVGTKFKAMIPFFGSAQVAASGEAGSGSERKASFTPVEVNLALPQEIANILEKINFKKFVIL